MTTFAPVLTPCFPVSVVLMSNMNWSINPELYPSRCGETLSVSASIWQKVMEIHPSIHPSIPSGRGLDVESLVYLDVMSLVGRVGSLLKK